MMAGANSLALLQRSYSTNIPTATFSGVSSGLEFEEEIAPEDFVLTSD